MKGTIRAMMAPKTRSIHGHDSEPYGSEMTPINPIKNKIPPTIPNPTPVYLWTDDVMIFSSLDGKRCFKARSNYWEI